jgi:hypothetical protein
MLQDSTMSRTQTINFVVTGDVRSGSSVVQSSLNKVRGVVCHQNLLHEDENVRRKEHEDYYGASAVPEWFQTLGSPWQYVNHQIFDNPQREEEAIGLRLPYNRIRAFQLYDLIHDRCMEGDFGLVHVQRNPVACYVSYMQAKATGIWSRLLNDAPQSMIPPPVQLDPAALTAFVRNHTSIRGKLEASCDDVLVVQYRDLVRDFRLTMSKVLDFIELPANTLVIPAYRRLRNRSMRERISNFDALKANVQPDVREMLLSGDLY